MERWDSCIFRDIQDVLDASKAGDSLGVNMQVAGPNGAMSPRDFHKAIAISGEQFYRTARTSQKNLPKYCLNELSTKRLPDIDNSYKPSKPEAKNATLPPSLVVTKPDLKKSLPFSFPKPVMISSTQPRSSTTEKLDAWRTTKQCSFVFENVISENLDEEPESESLVTLAPVKTRPRSRSSGHQSPGGGSVDTDIATRSKKMPGRRAVQSVNLGTELPSLPLDINDDDLVFNDEKTVIIGGTPQRLLEVMTDISLQEVFFITQFLAVYKFFLTTEEVIEHIYLFFLSPATPSRTITEVAQIRWLKKQRIRFIITKWVKNHPLDFFGNNKLCARMNEILTEINEPVATQAFKKYITSYVIPPPVASPSISRDDTEVFLLKFSADDLAQQLALADHKLFQRITTRELRDQKWVKKEADVLSPTIMRCIKHFNKISYWIATEIVKCCNLKDRVKTLKHAIHLAERCVVYRNYNTGMAITCGLSLAAVVRLKKTWKGLSAKYRTAFTELDQLFTAENNYQHYRELMISHFPPMIPYLGVFLKDLTFLDIGNPKYLDQEKRIINFDKLRMISSIISELRTFQEIPYQFTPDTVIQAHLTSTSTPFDEDQLFKISRILEPPEGGKREMSTSLMGKIRKRM